MTESSEKKSRGRRKIEEGQVISDKMNKTISVLVDRYKQHPKYGKYMRRSVVFKAHDEENTAKLGDKVRIYETRPLSKTKRWRLMEVIERAKTKEGAEL